MNNSFNYDLDTTPLSLGIETTGGIFTKLIERNTKLPTENSLTISTDRDNQTSVTITVLQGERGMAEDNYCIGRFTLHGVSPAPRGIPQIEITFAIDINRTLKVLAMDRASGRKEMFVTMLDELSKEDIENLVKDAQINLEIDREKRALAEAENDAEAEAENDTESLD
jgi:molecular chaperone DnaK